MKTIIQTTRTHAEKKEWHRRGAMLVRLGGDLGLGLGHVRDEVHNAVAVAPLVVVPGHDLHRGQGEEVR